MALFFYSWEQETVWWQGEVAAWLVQIDFPSEIKH